MILIFKIEIMPNSGWGHSTLTTPEESAWRVGKSYNRGLGSGEVGSGDCGVECGRGKWECGVGSVSVLWEVGVCGYTHG